jgi:hypothetical protein
MKHANDFSRERNYLLSQMGHQPSKCFLAGGAITSVFTNKPIADYDFYFKNRADFSEAVEWAYENGMFCVSNSGRAITFAQGGNIYQMMHFAFFETAQSIFDSFDFTCCMAALDLETGDFHFHPTFLPDTSKRDLIFNYGTAYPLASAMRVIKYQEKGYSIRKSEMLKVITACSMRQLSGWDDLRDQIGGRYGSAADLETNGEFSLEGAIKAIDALIETKPLTVDTPATAEEALAVIFGEAADEAA